MHKPKINQPQTPNVVQDRDLFQTPRYATELLIPFISKHVKLIWECACGFGRMVSVLKEHYAFVAYSDIKGDVPHHNFLLDDINLYHEGIDCIITNPPFSLKKKFFEKCLEYNLPFALLIPADYSKWVIDAIRHHSCEKIIPTSRINYITPNTLVRINKRHTVCYESLEKIPANWLAEDHKNSMSQFHSMWLTRYFDLGRTETFVELTKEMMKNV